MTLSSQHHSFDIKLAAMYGVEEAILIHHILHWVRINAANGKNHIDGRTWTYQTRKSIKDHFPYWNVDRVKYLCERLVSLGVLITGQYNKRALDRTLWYAFSDEKSYGVDTENSKSFYEKAKVPNAKGKSASAIPDTKERYIKESSLSGAKEKSASPPPPPDEENFFKNKFEGKIQVTPKEHQKLLERFKDEAMIDRVAEKLYLSSLENPNEFKKKKNHYATLCKWLMNEQLWSAEKSDKLKYPTLPIPNEKEMKNYTTNAENVEKLKQQSPKCSGMYVFYKDYTVKDKNNPMCAINALLDPKKFCRELEKVTGLTIFERWFPND